MPDNAACKCIGFYAVLFCYVVVLCSLTPHSFSFQGQQIKLLVYIASTLIC